jgi:hypothetical protein
MALDFPASPTNGQIYEQYVYDSALPGWRSKGGAVAATYVSDTAPSGAVKGDMWYRSSDGTTYVFVVDADSSQWVEIRSEVSTAQVGLVPIVPSSIVLGSGTGSVAVNGSVTFTGASTLSLNDVFSANYLNYRINIVMNQASSANTNIQGRLRVSGSDAATSYYEGGILQSGGSLAGVNNLNQGIWNLGRTHSAADPNAHASISVKIFQPFLAKPTTSYTESTAWTNTETVSFRFSGFHTGLTSYTGLTLISATGTFGGVVKVYGYN